jgi:hypothetical protein
LAGYTVAIASEGTDRLVVTAKFWSGPNGEWLAAQPCWSDTVGLFYWANSDVVYLRVKSQRITTSVAYLARDGTIVSIVDVMANDSRIPTPMANAYALQVRRGLLADRAVKAGDRAFVRNNGITYPFPNIPGGG